MQMDIALIIQKIMSIPYMPSILSWISFGLTAGLVAKIILPGQEGIGWLRTIGVGILGAFLGGLFAAYMGYQVNIGWNLVGFIFSVLGSIVLLLINRIVTRT